MKKILFVAALLTTWSCKSGGHQHSASCSHVESTIEHSDDDGHDHSQESKMQDGHDHSNCNGDHGTEEGHNHGTEENHDHSSESADTHSEHEGDDIIVNPSQAKLAGVATQKVVVGALANTLRVSGVISSSTAGEKSIAAPVSGIVSYAGLLTEGTAVGSSAVFYISSQGVAEGDYVSRLEAAYVTAEKDFRRAESLVADSIISRRDYESAQLAYKNAKIAYEAVAAKNGKEGVKVSSPISGYIKSLLVQNGAYVGVGEPLAIVTTSNRLQLRAELPERYYDQLASFTDADIVTSSGKSYNLSSIGGRRISYGRSNDSNFYLPITFEFNNIGDIASGSYVEVYLKGSPSAQGYIVPLSSIVEEYGRHYLYKKVGKNIYSKVYVDILSRDGSNVKVKGDLKNGDDVVSSGAYQIKMASMSSAIPHGHAH